MEAARTLAHPLAELRARRFERECEELRPLGVAYALRRFGHTLDHADAEDAVSDVIIRLHRGFKRGRVPDNLRAAFFTGVRNASIDQLRSRGARPTVPLEAVAEAPTPAPDPEHLAESGEDLVLLREAMARMRPNYREAIALRFGLGLTVPEISERLAISLPAAKKLVLRATNQIRQRMEAITGQEFCSEMRSAAERSLFDAEAAGAASAEESAAIRAHFEHCGSCRTFLTALRSNLHELGGSALIAGYAGREGAHHLAVLGERLLGIAHSGAARLRLLAFRTNGSFRGDDPGASSALFSSGQKIAAVCTAGAATATCLATGLVGPGVGVVAVNHHASPPALHRPAEVHDKAPPPVTPTEVGTPASASSAAAAAETQTSSVQAKAKSEPSEHHAARKKTAAAEPAARASAQSQEEFGFESEPEPEPAPEASSGYEPTARASSSAESSAPEPASPSPSSSSGGSSGGGGAEKFGFRG